MHLPLVAGREIQAPICDEANCCRLEVMLQWKCWPFFCRPELLHVGTHQHISVIGIQSPKTAAARCCLCREGVYECQFAARFPNEERGRDEKKESWSR